MRHKPKFGLKEQTPIQDRLWVAEDSIRIFYHEFVSKERNF